MTSRNQMYSPASRAISTGRSPARSVRSPTQTSPPVPPPKPVQPAAKANEPQPTLRVMRLYKPRFKFSPAVPYSSQVDLLNGGISTVDQSMSKLLLGRRESDFALSSCLILPDSFGDIYRGETFCAYISVLNHLSVELKNVKVTARLVTPSSKKNLPLADCRLERGATESEPQATDVLPQGKKLDMVIQSVLNETGDYVLKVSVECIPPVYQTYTPPPPSFQNLPGGVGHPAQQQQYQQQQLHAQPRAQSVPHIPQDNMLAQAQAQYGQHQGGLQPQQPPQPPAPPEPKKFTKYYRFSVTAPVELSNTCRIVGGNALVEVSVKNTTPHDLVVSDLVLVAAEGYESINISALSSQANTSGIGYHAVTHLKPKPSLKKGGDASSDGLDASSSFMSSADCLDKHLLLAPQDVRQFLFRISTPSNRPIETLGQPLGAIHVQWRTALGESGTLKTPPIIAPISIKREFVVTVAPHDNQEDKEEQVQKETIFELGQSMDIKLRVYNYSDRALPLHLRWSVPNIGGTGLSSLQQQQRSQLLQQKKKSSNNLGGSTQSSGSSGNLSSSSTGSNANSSSNSSENRNITVYPSSVPGVLVQGTTSFNLGTVGKQGGYAECTISLLALCPGMHGLLGFVVVDESSGRQWRQPSLTTLLVQPKDYGLQQIPSDQVFDDNSQQPSSISSRRRTSSSTSSLLTPISSPAMDLTHKTSHNGGAGGGERRRSEFEEQIIIGELESSPMNASSGNDEDNNNDDEDEDEPQVLLAGEEVGEEYDTNEVLMESMMLTPPTQTTNDTMTNEEQINMNEGNGEEVEEEGKEEGGGEEEEEEEGGGDQLDEMPSMIPPLLRQTTGGGVHGDGSNDAIPSSEMATTVTDSNEIDLGLLMPLDMEKNSEKNNENDDDDANNDDKDVPYSDDRNMMMESISFGDDTSTASAFFDAPPPMEDAPALLSATSIEEMPSDDEGGGGFTQEEEADAEQEGGQGETNSITIEAEEGETEDREVSKDIVPEEEEE